MQKWYFHDEVSPVQGTLPSGDMLIGTLGTGTNASGSSIARATYGLPGASNPDIETLITAANNTSAQRLFHRRFVIGPLAAQSMNAVDTWNFNFAALESNTNHNGAFHCRGYLWRPSTGAQVGSWVLNLGGTSGLGRSLTSTSETSYPTNTNIPSNTTSVLDGDVIIIEISDEFAQAMSSTYTSSFAYNGTTDNSTTTNASFIENQSTDIAMLNQQPKYQYYHSEAVRRAAYI